LDVRADCYKSAIDVTWSWSLPQKGRLHGAAVYRDGSDVNELKRSVQIRRG